MNLPTGVVLHDYKIPVKGVAKKILYHISDIHLNHSDDPDAKMQPLTYETWLKGWPGFSIQYNEPYAPEQMKLPEEHLTKALADIPEAEDNQLQKAAEILRGND